MAWTARRRGRSARLEPRIKDADAALQEWEPGTAQVELLRDWVGKGDHRANPDLHHIGVKAANWSRVAAPYWPSVLGEVNQWRRVTRGSVFDVAEACRGGSWMPLMAATFAWGYGDVGYGPARLRAILEKNDPAHIEVVLARAVAELSREGAETAYRVLRPKARNAVWGFGPAFFTKFLYFAGWRMKLAGPKPVIMDAQVAASVRQIAHHVYTRAGIDDDMASWLWPKGNWWAHRYGQYVELAHRVASSLPGDLMTRPDSLELALFDEEFRATGIWQLS